MIYLISNITDISNDPKTIRIGDIVNRMTIEIDPGETVDVERFSTRNQILDSAQIKVHLLEGRITVDTLGTPPRERIHVDAVIDSGSINVVNTVAIVEPIQISASVGGVEVPLSGLTIDGYTYLDTNPLLPSKPTIKAIPIVSANSEQSYKLPANTKCYLVKVRDSGANLKLAFLAGETSGNDFIFVRRGIAHIEKDVDAGAITLYFQADKPNEIVEITSWAV